MKRAGVDEVINLLHRQFRELLGRARNFEKLPRRWQGRLFIRADGDDARNENFEDRVEPFVSKLKHRGGRIRLCRVAQEAHHPINVEWPLV
jgi:hypothetical protein